MRSARRLGWLLGIAITIAACVPLTPMPGWSPLATQVEVSSTPAQTATVEREEPTPTPKLPAWPIPAEGYPTPEAGLALAAFESRVPM